MNSEIEREAVADALGQYFNTIGIGLKIKTKREAAAAAIAAMPLQSLLAQAQEVAILHGQQVTVTFKDSGKAFDLFNELRDRAALQPNAGEGR